MLLTLKNYSVIVQLFFRTFKSYIYNSNQLLYIFKTILLNNFMLYSSLFGEAQNI